MSLLVILSWAMFAISGLYLAVKVFGLHRS